jgi:uncharacterized repeat protein (TIGR01451 family)
MAYDTDRAQLVLFGGFGETSYLDDTWTWDGANWHQLSPGPGPSPRSAASMAYNGGSGDLILFGGVDASGVRSDTWEWDGSYWLRDVTGRTEGIDLPSARASASMAPWTGDVLLFGGSDGTPGGFLQDTWRFSGGGGIGYWARESSTSSPSPRVGAAMAHDASGAVILFGGADSAALADTWTWNGDWSRVSPRTSPPAGAFMPMSYDPTNGGIVLLASAPRSTSDTWLFAPTSAADLSVALTGPTTTMPGSNISYAITVHNGGPDDAVGPRMADPLPSGVTFASESHPAGWSCTDPAPGANGTVECTASTLPNGASGSFTVTVHVPATAAVGATISNTASAASATDDFTTVQTATADTRVTVDHPTVSGTVSGGATYSGGSWVISGANITGNVRINSGANVVIVNSTIGGNLNASGSGSVTVCGSTVGGGTSVSGATGFVLLGDPGDDSCAANQLRSGVTLSSNHGGAELADNQIGGNVSVTGTTGAGPFPDDTRAEIEGNTIAGNLSCSGNTPTATNDGQTNSVGGSRSGECAASRF